ncbi:MAG TPA: aspartyl protease family protein [Streptosporangiaceae bacterium]|nr:aspartyl protease family protein [Streptosporangiaceae bacterium]
MPLVPLIIEPEPDDPDAASVMVDAIIAGRPYRLLLDTGAARSQLNSDEYTSALPTMDQAGSAAAFGGVVTMPVVTVTDVVIGPLRLAELDVRRSDRALPQLLGMDVLGRCRWHLQLAAGVLDFDVPPDVKIDNELTLGPRGHVYLEVSWPGIAARACWDTGAGATVVDRAFWLAHPQLFEQIGATGGTDANGRHTETPLLLMNGPVIGTYQFTSHKAVAVDLAPVNSTLEYPMDLILGYPTIRLANWLFDFPARRWTITT